MKPKDQGFWNGCRFTPRAQETVRGKWPVTLVSKLFFGAYITEHLNHALQPFWLYRLLKQTARDVVLLLLWCLQFQVHLILSTAALGLRRKMFTTLDSALEATWSCEIMKLVFYHYFRVYIGTYRRHEIACIWHIFGVLCGSNAFPFCGLGKLCLLRLGEQFLLRLLHRPPELSRERSVSSLLNLTDRSHWVTTGSPVFAGETPSVE